MTKLKGSGHIKERCGNCEHPGPDARNACEGFAPAGKDRRASSSTGGRARGAPPHRDRHGCVTLNVDPQRGYQPGRR